MVNEKKEREHKKCPKCRKPLIWQNDWDSEDMGFEGKGIISCWSCNDCLIEEEIFVKDGVQ